MYLVFLKWSLNFLDDNNKPRLSGVVIKICGGFLTILALSLSEVSPDLTATLISGTSSSNFSASAIISSKGCLKFLSISFASAFSGET